MVRKKKSLRTAGLDRFYLEPWWRKFNLSWIMMLMPQTSVYEENVSDDCGRKAHWSSPQSSPTGPSPWLTRFSRGCSIFDHFKRIDHPLYGRIACHICLTVLNIEGVMEVVVTAVFPRFLEVRDYGRVCGL